MVPPNWVPVFCEWGLSSPAKAFRELGRQAYVRDSALKSMNLYLCFMKLIKVSYLLHLAIFVHNV